ncbi:ead/Ea22-like family protein [Escherichia coli]|uniref:ead/Ea22-like family protein n=1 Tax=Escherichia coli TaxID=562 RepID=UPI000BE615AC|nr:ead/Ea22-like family protein [Escherichia coli]EKK1619960.1 ead/Ea22-like family protein [Escherichia coli]
MKSEGLTPEQLAEIEIYYPLRERYSPKPAPKCPVCGEEMSMQRISGSHVVYACSGMEDDGCFKTGRTYADEHYKNSRISVVDGSDPDVIELLDENVEMALTLEKLRVELEAAKKCIAELESNSGALVAECQNKKAALEAILSHLPINHPDIDIACVANIAHNELGEAKSTISEAYLVEIQAQGLEAFALTMRDTGDDPFFDSVASACADAADRFAALLRKGQSCLRPNFKGER